MSPVTESLIRLLCLPSRREEILGDFAELRSTYRSAFGELRDLMSVCLLQSRLRGWRVREWVRAGVVAGALAAIAGSGPIAAVRASSPRSINGHDAAGVFTLELRGSRVRSATMDGLPFPLERIERSEDQVVFETGDPARDLAIQLFPDGSIEWEGRDGRAVTNEETPIELDWAREYFDEAGRAGRLDAGSLWGVDLYGPILFVDRESRFVVANAEDTSGILKERDGIWVGEFPRDRNVANTALEWAGRRWTMVIWPLPSDRYARQKLIFHELFHRVQPELGIGSEDVVNDHLDTRDGRIWLRLEWRALAEALVRRGEERHRAVEDALTFRARRHALFPAAGASERALELNEGLSEYTGLVMSGLPAGVLADRAAVELGQREHQESYTRSFAYASGPAYGLLLDQADVEWRGKVNQQSDLPELLAGALEIEMGSAGAESRAARYSGGRVIAQEESRAKRTSEREAQLRALFVDGPTLTLPVASSFGYSFNPNAATPLPGVGTVYDTARVTDDWGILEVTSGGVLLVRPEGSITKAVVPLAESGPVPPIEGDGWTVELGDGWRLGPAPNDGSWTVEPRETKEEGLP